MSNYLTPREIAQVTGFSTQKVRRLISMGKIPAVNTSTGAGRPSYTVRLDDLKCFLQPAAVGEGDPRADRKEVVATC